MGKTFVEDALRSVHVMKIPLNIDYATYFVSMPPWMRQILVPVLSWRSPTAIRFSEISELTVSRDARPSLIRLCRYLYRCFLLANRVRLSERSYSLNRLAVFFCVKFLYNRWAVPEGQLSKFSLLISFTSTHQYLLRLACDLVAQSRMSSAVSSAMF